MESTLKETLAGLLIFFTSLSYLVCFFGAFFFGAETIIILGFLSAQRLVKFWIVFVFCALGMFSADTMWFFVGKIRSFSKLKKFKYIRKSYLKTSEFIEDISRGQIFLTLTLLKFVYGIAIPIIMYIGRREKLTYKKFAIYNGAIIAPWALGLAILGWLAGKGYSFVVRTYENLTLSIFALVLAFIIIHILIAKIRKWLLKEERSLGSKNKQNS